MKKMIFAIFCIFLLFLVGCEIPVGSKGTITIGSPKSDEQISNEQISEKSNIISDLFFSLFKSEKKLEKEAERTAQAFSIAWQNEEWESLYVYFTNELKSQRSEEDFIKFIYATNPTEFKIIYDKVVLQDKKEAYAYYTFSGSYLYQPKTPAIHMIYEDGSWKFDAFVSYFIDACAEESCNDYDKCTLDLCNSGTSFICKHERIETCCNSARDCPSGKSYCLSNTCSKDMCSINRDCPSSLPICYNKKCVECSFNSDCKTEEWYICRNNKCIICATDLDCVQSGWHSHDIYGNELYDLPFCVSNECVQCKEDNDCGYNEICSKNRCVEVECKTNSNCGDDYPFCSLNHCVMCLKDSDCNSVSWCDILDCYCSTSNFCSTH